MPDVAAPTTLFTRLVDDAALFPPAREPMDIAVIGHLRRREDSQYWIMGRFLCTGARIGELQKFHGTGRIIELGLILREPEEVFALNSVTDDAHHRLTGIELGPQFPLAIERRDVPIYQEIDRGEDLGLQLDRISDLEMGAKLRTGGLTAVSFPHAAEVASFIAGCVERNIWFKCTAGLHHALPYTDSETGFGHHGFLNILLATHEVVVGGDPVAVLTNREGAALAERAAALTPDEAERIRISYHGHGSCHVSDATADLTRLGLI